MQHMLDASKVADLVIILIDASYGYEMDTFEFINILQIHGFPRAIGVLTHLDMFKSDNKAIRKCKNDFKKRFWAEIYDGAKLFYLSKLKNNRYDKIEISNLARFISVQKPITLSWRTSHPYTVSLRHELLDNITYFYGYVYGGRFATDQHIHIPGAGDFQITSIQDCNDPCPIPTVGKRTLQDKQRGIYAPGCDIGMVMLDDEDMYITLPNVKTHFTEGIDSDDEQNVTDAVRMVRQLQKVDRPLDNFNSEFKLTTDSVNLINGDNMNLYNHFDNPITNDNTNIETKKNVVDELDKRTNDNKTVDPFLLRTQDNDIDFQCNELMKLIYKPVNLSAGSLLGNHLSDISKEEDLFDPNLNDQRIFDIVLKDTNFDELINSEMVQSLFKKGTDKTNGDSDAENDDHYEYNSTSENENDHTNDDMMIYDESDPHFITKKQRLQEQLRQREYMETFDFKGIESVQKHLSSSFIGKYVKIGVSNVPKSWLDKVKDKSSVVVIGGLLHGESNFGHTLIRVKRHRWAPKILKNEDPILFSIGWRRFQSLPLYCMEDRNKVRVKMLKYTPEHLHCLAVVYGPLAPPNTGVVGIKNWNKIKSYRISLTGVVLGEASDVKVVKKLKLIGEPHKIYKNTAFIKGMFNSSLEASRCIGARIQTVSGIRGVIKKADRPDGIVRASFEDKIIPSDLVIMKSYVPVTPKSVYNPILDEGGSRIRSIVELKGEFGVAASIGNPYPLKSALTHPVKNPSTIKIPTNLVKNLPFQSRPKKIASDTQIESLPIITSPEHSKSAVLFTKLMTIRKARQERRAEKAKLHRAKVAMGAIKSNEARDAIMRKRIKKRNMLASKKHAIMRDKLAI